VDVEFVRRYENHALVVRKHVRDLEGALRLGGIRLKSTLL
jgi:hypothetical protein